MKKISLLLLFFIFSFVISSNLFFKWRITDIENEQLKEKTSDLFKSNYDLYEKIILNYKAKKNRNLRNLSQNKNLDEEEEPILMASRYTHCQKCVTFVKAIKKIKDQYGFNALYNNTKEELCRLLKSLNIFEVDGCRGMIDNYISLAVENFFSKYIDTLLMCEKLELCPSQNPNKYVDPDEYALNILKDKKEHYKEKEVITNKKQLKVLQVTDIHLDLKYNENGKAECYYPMCCRDTPTSEESGNVTECGSYAYEGKSDISKELFQSFLNHSLSQDIDFIIWTGDNGPHDIWETFQEEVLETNRVIKKMFDETLNYYEKNNIPIYFCLGNHERYPSDNYQDNEEELLKNYSNIYNDYLNDNEAINSFRSSGSFSIKREDNLTIISINCMLCDSFNFHLYNSTKTHTVEMFKWLEKELKEAEENGNYVYILNHFPLNGDFTLTECAKRFQALFDRYEYTIRGIFSGHTHRDDLEGITEYFNKDRTIHLNFIAPSLTTYEYMLPSYRIYNIDEETKRIISYEQYRFDLEGSKNGECELNKKSGEENSCWYLAYNANEFYNVKDLSEYDKIVNFRDMESYVTNQYAGSKLGKKYSKDPIKKKIGKCNIITNNFDDYVECSQPDVGFTSDYLALFSEFLIGPLEERE